MIEEGDVSPEGAEALSTMSEALDRYFAAIPGEAKPRHDQVDFNIQDGDMLLLAPGGIAVLAPEQIARCCRNEPQDAVECLIAEAVANESDDDITVLAASLPAVT